jgi:hypothetical protein
MRRGAKMLSQVFRSRIWLSVLLFVCLPILVFLTGSGDSLAAEYAMDKGSEMFGINAGFISASGDLYQGGGKPFTAILVMPQTVHFFARNLGFGGDLLLLVTAQGDNKSTTLGVGPKVMYFFGGKGSKSYPYLTAGFYYLRNDIQYESIDVFTKGLLYGTRWKLGFGSSWNVTPKLGILMEASYNRDKLKHEDTKESKTGNMVIVSIGLVGFSF